MSDSTGTPVPELIPRDVLFGNPDRAAVRLSPDGAFLSYLAPLDGVLNVWVAPAEDVTAARPLTRDTGRGIQIYFWAYTNRHVLYLKDEGGNENWNVFIVPVDGEEAPRNLTPNPRIAARIMSVSHKHPESILVGLNERDPRLHDVYRIELDSGQRTLVKPHPETINGESVAAFVTDDEYQVRFATTFTADGGHTIYRPMPDGDWEPWAHVGFEDTMVTHLRGFDKTGRRAYLADSRGRDTGALKLVDLDTGDEQFIAADPKADPGHLLAHPTEKTPQAVSFTYEKTRWEVLDDSVRPDFDYLRSLSADEFDVASRTLDDRRWIVAYSSDTGPTRYELYDRDGRRTRFLFNNRDALANLPLAKMHPRVIRSRDGLDLVSYLTLPRESDADEDGRPDRPLPMALLVHGGPWGRDGWGYDSTHQWLANRGYAVLSVNFRGSTGFGKGFVNASNLEWGRKMHDDLIDAVNWAVDQGIARRDKVAIMGGSYGGYAALAGLTFTPDVFACGVDIVGPSNLVTLLKTVPPYWAPMMMLFRKRVGDLETEEGRRMLEERSPLNHVDRIAKPLLIGQGANDPRVKQSESDQIVGAMREKKIPVTYAIYADEGHGFARPQNRLSFFAVAEGFLAHHLGGRFEPVGRHFFNSTIQVPVGDDQVPGLTEALAAKESP